MRVVLLCAAFAFALACSNNTAPFCGDGTCGGSESCSTCPSDCGACPASCGDGRCGSGETCSTCPRDCGMCTPTGCSTTCGGCCDGEACLSGASSAACGADGLACVDCGPDSVCDGGTCFIDPASRWNIVLESIEVSATRYDGAAWDTIGGSPDLFVAVVVGRPDAVPAATTPTTNDTYAGTYDTSVPVLVGARADEIGVFLGFAVFDDDSPASPELIGYCGYDASMGSALVFSTDTQTVSCPIDAGSMNSGYTLRWRVERF